MSTQTFKNSFIGEAVMENTSKASKEECENHGECSGYLDGMCVDEQGNIIKTCNLCVEYLGEI